MTNRAPDDRWDRLADVAPYTKAVFEMAAARASNPTLHGVPWTLLGLADAEPGADGWLDLLDRRNSIDNSVTNREVLLRYLLSRAIVDQGADIIGVEMWHSAVLKACYEHEPPLRIIHDPRVLAADYAQVLQFAAAAETDVKNARADIWASQSATRRAGAYTPYNGPGGSGPYSHWFLAARFYPALLLALTIPGGLTDLVFRQGPLTERPIGMARRLRNDHSYGLGFCLGDKAADLFTKWTVGTFRLTPPESKPWVPADTVIPMDQRIGRVMMRSGLMDEFFGVAALLGKPMFEYRGTGSRPAGNALPNEAFYLTVRDFRRDARVPKGGDAEKWLARAWSRYHSSRTPPWAPQEVVSLLCRVLSDHREVEFTPVHLDDFFMSVGEAPCTDQEPNCPACPLSTACQANAGGPASALKRYFT